MTIEDDQPDTAQLVRLNAELTSSLVRWRAPLPEYKTEYKARPPANSNEPVTGDGFMFLPQDLTDD